MKPRFKLNTDGTFTRMDAIAQWANPVNGRGMAFADASAFSRFAGSRSALTSEYLSALYRYDWLARKICQRPAEDATRKFIVINEKKDSVKRKINQKLEQLGVKGKCRKAIAWSRLFGGSALIMLISDGKGPEEEYTGGGKLVDIIVTDRHHLTVAEKNQDPSSPYYDMPEIWERRNGAKFHRSRVFCFKGADLTLEQMEFEDYWGGSYVELALDAVRAFQESHKDMGHLLSEASLGVFTLSGAQMASAMGGKPAEGMAARAAYVNQGKSIYRSIIIDKDNEGFDFKSRNLGGASDIVDTSMTIVSGAVSIPELVLFGKSPSGLNASQEEIMGTYFDMVRSEQEGDLAVALKFIITMICDEMGLGEVEWDFAPLLEMSENQKADVMGKVSTAVSGIADAAALEPKEVRDVLNKSGAFDLPDYVELDEEDVEPLISEEELKENGENKPDSGTKEV
ncbi:portal protein [Yersinia phage vB_YenM_636]|nr:portal protein [Yersinia phage vB_YenM_12]QKN86396.1 portal protein [Yersinia phage vB_YenM_22]QKN86487.1 portal protein [Yersinia phage vB_YenM_25]QKN86578.1 portal protein [Yersinia phage vB_YenM_27]QKN86669.1 portal protein [Yersinia phage vB_YenM_39]QKN86760.1 portal protein [Yersinia phage vB_YenM_126]QKN86851.1 portal protein [Yersinia phage vB_YenM_526-1]QKN86942.1 portal protein [Yersinia phage vB_YenM_526-2]QKN87033.1 portal protein [Yersinia phage vB_YenM_531]QKN87125.1 portal